jgi:DNA-binding MarR family transcriptional regulator
MTAPDDSATAESVLDLLGEPPPRGLFTRLSRVAIHLSKLQNDAIEGLGLSFSDFTVLNTLRRFGDDGGLPVVRLSRLVLRPTGSMTLILDRLEKAGLIARRPDPGDRRSILIVLTAEGEDTSRRIAETYDQLQREILADVSDEELLEIDRAVRRMLEILEPPA